MVVSRVLLSLWLLMPPAAAECWGANTDTFLDCTADYADAEFHCSGSMCASATCTLGSACNACAVHYPSAVLDEAEGVCCASVSSNGTCVGPESGDNPPSADDDIYEGHEPEERKQALIFEEFAAWSSCIAAGSLLTMHLLYVPETRQQMRPRMLLVLLAFDFLAGLFFGLSGSPVFSLSNKYNNQSDNTNVDSILYVLG